MYDLCLNPEVARRLALAEPEERPASPVTTEPHPEPEAVPSAEEGAGEEMTTEERYAAAFAMILYWSRHGGY